MEPFLQEMQREEYAPIAVYGTGANAEWVLRSALGERVSFVVARDHVGEQFLGHEVQALADVLPHCRTIIIAATPRSTRQVYERIASLVPPDKYVFNMYGLRLNAPQAYRENPYWQQTYAGLQRAIAAHAVISFDCFDTLFMRRVLEPKDLFAVVERQVGGTFAATRVAAERAAVKAHGYPTLREIYARMQTAQGLSAAQGDRLMAQEMATERLALCPRRPMLAALREAIGAGKRVFITTDTYFPADFIRELLQGVGIVDGYTVLASCECRASKADGSLYAQLRARTGQASILHIGDNRVTDGLEAEHQGLDTFSILSAYDLLQASSGHFVCEAAKSLDERLVLGNILAEVLQDPFALAASRGQLAFHTAGMLTLMCQLPVVQGYLAFLLRHVRGESQARVLFVSRDGYFLKQVYDRLRAEDDSLPESLYFYTSREAVTRAVCQSEQDIDVLLSDFPQLHGMTLRHALERRFYIDFSDLPDGFAIETAFATWGAEKVRQLVMARKEEILEQSAQARQGYMAYLAANGLTAESKEKIFLVDLCTRGTVAYGLGRMLGRPVELLALGGLLMPNAYVQMEHVSAYLGLLTPFSSSHSLFSVLELLLASREGQAAGFDTEGRPYFAEGTVYDAALLDEVQGGWLRMLDSPWLRFLRWQEMDLSPAFVTQMMELVRAAHSLVDEPVLSQFAFTDPLSSRPRSNVLVNVRG